MLKELDLSKTISKEEYRTFMDELRPRLTMLQQQIIKAKIPVIIIFEGLGAAGKGAAVNSLILNFDARGFTVYNTNPPESSDLRVPWLTRFADKMPAYGRMAVFDRAWYSGVLQLLGTEAKPKKYQSYFEQINTFERQLADDGYVILKYFLYIDKKEQKKRLMALEKQKSTKWRVTDQDLRNLKNHDAITRFYDAMIMQTDKPYAAWHGIAATDKRYVRSSIFSSIAEELENALKRQQAQRKKADVPFEPWVSARFHLLPHRHIGDLTLNQELPEEEYRAKLPVLQKRLFKLQNALYVKKMPVILCYEGNDAAGKGGNIRRVAQSLDARGYSVTPIAAPSPDELSRQYLWRFWKSLPRTGHIRIFDRTWYGRVLVERVEGITPIRRINQAYNEINEFEHMLHKWGAVILKFWLAIDKDEQLKRFQDRQNTPEKQWKITDEDWRNREKWDVYANAVNDMFHYTNTDFAPWYAIESNNKYYARLRTIETMIEAIENRL